MMSTILPKIISTTLLMLVFLPIVAFAQTGIVPCTNDCTVCHFWELGFNIVERLLILIIPFGVIAIVAAGVVLITSRGNESRYTRAKEILGNAVFGLLLAFAAWLIINTIFATLATGSFQTAWNVFPTCGMS